MTSWKNTVKNIVTIRVLLSTKRPWQRRYFSESNGSCLHINRGSIPIISGCSTSSMIGGASAGACSDKLCQVFPLVTYYPSRYDPGQHFSPHYDGRYVKSSNELSKFTFMAYLNGDFEGGATNFLNDRKEAQKTGVRLRRSIQPEEGYGFHLRLTCWRVRCHTQSNLRIIRSRRYASNMIRYLQYVYRVWTRDVPRRRSVENKQKVHYAQVRNGKSVVSDIRSLTNVVL